VLVSVDMEGIAGVVDRDDISPGHGEYERNRTLLTAEASAAVRGVHAYEADARVLVTEAHAAFRNLLPELLVPGIERKDGRTLRYAAPDFLAAYRVAELITMLGGI